MASYEKFIIDIEILQNLMVEFPPLEITDESMAFDAHLEVGHGGHFLGAAHTMDRFRDCFYRPFLSNSDNHERWTRLGSRDAVARAGEIYQKRLADYVQPDIDPSIVAELEDFMSMRKSVLDR